MKVALSILLVVMLVGLLWTVLSCPAQTCCIGLLAGFYRLGQVFILVIGIVALCGLLRFKSLSVTTITSVQVNGAKEGQEEKTPLKRC